MELDSGRRTQRLGFNSFCATCSISSSRWPLYWRKLSTWKTGTSCLYMELETVRLNMNLLCWYYKRMAGIVVLLTETMLLWMAVYTVSSVLREHQEELKWGRTKINCVCFRCTNKNCTPENVKCEQSWTNRFLQTQASYIDSLGLMWFSVMCSLRGKCRFAIV